ncbi:hypothetical protein BSL78_22758 [Apostichopus japonicus]|uniref:Uncharacterized protein n=1 Tax=Stichopus japonicus TaxID=307972 RepID=A0A2G8JXJ3_STIJA|nr:hypothetical protein BSL78_22758 [Apostichopus japonicus]
MASNSVINELFSQKNVNPPKKAKSAAGKDIIEPLLSQRGSCQDKDSAHSDHHDDGSDDVESKVEFLRRQNQIFKDGFDESEKKVEAAQNKVEDWERPILKDRSYAARVATGVVEAVPVPAFHTLHLMLLSSPQCPTLAARGGFQLPFVFHLVPGGSCRSGRDCQPAH